MNFEGALEAHHEALNRQDATAAIEIFTSDAVIRSGDETFRGSEAISAYYADVLTRWARVRYTAQAHYGRGDHLVCIASLDALGHGRWFPSALQTVVAHRWVHRDGRAVALDQFQLHAVPPELWEQSAGELLEGVRETPERADVTDRVAALKMLAEIREVGGLTAEEFDHEKARILRRS